ncbi:NfeD family protein [Pseudomonas vlassakiae]|jgi:membrane protein implicated in regulation of membrane protease activity|uniref:NfeD family protein n=1 Tax=Pseudomonas TaxID=286 RepID=UPI0006D435DF|nr:MULTISPECIES: NfeD family protein [Pseudomonas]AXQ46634.1 NfeD family protein [Stenotrophomonas rhizophila]MBO9550999.1 NfeD family protein [Pseudomonas sp.]MBS3188340.1 NfeD family protein [Pseudomonas sp. PCH44]MCU0125711.1 NfeD family protein [Pseudomonas vlassakiae]PIK78876.1 NfeD family protein [Pseudomonas sp. 382]
MEMQWWIWLVFGIGLILLELVLPTFFIIWFGIGAVLVSLIALAAPALQLDMQVLLWVLFSSVTTFLWFKLFKRKQPDVRWTADSVIGEVGLLTSSVSQFQKGRVRFQKPLLGNEEWTCVADGDIPAGERVRLVAIEGNTARVVRA